MNAEKLTRNKQFDAETGHPVSGEMIANTSIVTAFIMDANDTIHDCSAVIPRGAANLAFFSSLLIIACGVPGNVLTIIALIKCAPNLLKNATTKFVINLAIADLIFCTFNLPMTSVRFLTCSWPFGDCLCQLYPFIFYGNVAVSLLTITCITIDRFVLIAFNDRHKCMCSPRNVWFMIAFCWIFSFGLLSLPLFEIWGKMGEDHRTFSCTILRNKGRSPKKFLFVFGFLIPSVAISVCYSIIWYKVKRQRILSIATNRKMSKRDIKLTKLIAVIFFVFVLCFAPLLISNVVLPKDRYPYLQVTSSILAWFSACVNPLIYFVMNRQYRNAFKRLIRPTFITTSSFKSNAFNESTLSNS
ncbi:protein trapped in endoderm-1-like protein [Leptotrombidium deliense]|uniref:Protein trapped in endoderm-1-like protein n=1 Tax=Leptotrombidium deliense TaxID=299467 RepID=A0A443SBX6_9ACAR|nr:protein trapped in endoderm-1-like protein [Leptotrombidium deliense]